MIRGDVPDVPCIRYQWLGLWREKRKKERKENMKELKTETEFRDALKESKIAVVDFLTTWCGPCKAVSPILEDLSEDYEKDEKNITKFFKVDCDILNKVADEFNIQSVPTVVFFVDGVKKGDFIVGGKPKETYKKTIDGIIEKSQKVTDASVPSETPETSVETTVVTTSTETETEKKKKGKKKK